MTSDLSEGTIVLLAIWIVSGAIGVAIYVMNPGESGLGTLTFAAAATAIWALARWLK